MGYNEIVLNEGVKFNYLVYKQSTPTQSEIDIMNDPYVEPTFDTMENLGIVAPFTSNLQSTDIKDLTEPVIGWSVYRVRKGDTKETFIGQVSKEQFFIYDYTCENNSEYSYNIIPVTENALGISLQSEKILADWWCYSLISLVEIETGVYSPEEIWTFDYNLSSTNITQNINTSVQQTFARTPKISKGQNNYQTMGITALLGGFNEDCLEYIETQNLLEKWQEFVGKDRLCIWKDRKGAVKLGKITDTPTTKFTDETIQQLSNVTFNFTESGNIEDITIYGTQDKTFNSIYNITTT